MHWLASLLCSFILCIGVLNADVYPVQKLIVSSHKDASAAQENLLKLKVYLLENNTTRLLEDTYQFNIKMEHYAHYNAVVISPINTLQERNALLVLLSPVFPDIFYIDEKKVSAKIKDTSSESHMTKSTSSVTHRQKRDEETWLNEIGLQWLAIWILAVIGLILSIRSRRKMAHLNKRQKAMNVDQTKIEKEIKALGDKDA